MAGSRPGRFPDPAAVGGLSHLRSSAMSPRVASFDLRLPKLQRREPFFVHRAAPLGFLCLAAPHPERLLGCQSPALPCGGSGDRSQQQHGARSTSRCLLRAVSSLGGCYRFPSFIICEPCSSILSLRLCLRIPASLACCHLALLSLQPFLSLAEK